MSGLPCVASDVGDVRVALDGAGLVVPPEDAAALASALGELVSPQKRRELGAAAHDARRRAVRRREDGRRDGRGLRQGAEPVSSATLHSVAGPGTRDRSRDARRDASRARRAVRADRAPRLGAARGRSKRPPTGLPAGPAQAEAVAVRLRRQGVELEWGAPDELAGPRELLELCRARGRSLGRDLPGRPDPPDRARARSVVPGRAPSSPHAAAPVAAARQRPRSCAPPPTARSGPVRGQPRRATSGADSRPRTARSSTTGSPATARRDRSASISIRAASPPSSAFCAGSVSAR